MHGYHLCKFAVTAQQGSSTVIAQPGQHVELLCNVTLSGSQIAAWIIDNGVYTVRQLHYGIMTGYSSNGNNLIIENIMMNDIRNNTWYSCGTVSSTLSNPTVADIHDESDLIILYVAGEYQYIFMYIATNVCMYTGVLNYDHKVIMTINCHIKTALVTE